MASWMENLFRLCEANTQSLTVVQRDDLSPPRIVWYARRREIQPLETNVVIRTTLSIVAAASLALGFVASTAFAQGTAPAAPAGTATAKPPVTKAPVAKTPASAPATAKVPAAKAEPKKAASACQGLTEANCKGNTACGWVVPKSANAQTGKVTKPYCRVVAGVAKKAADKKAAATTKAPTQTAAAPKAPAKPTAAAKPPAAAAGAPKTQ